MSIQRHFTKSNVMPIDRKVALDDIAVRCVSRPMPNRDTVCPDAFSATCLTIVRFISAAYTTGEAACWETALQLSDDALDAEHGPLLVARLATLLRTLRRINKHEFVSLPAPCSRVTLEEQRLMLVIEAARRKDQDGLIAAVSALVDTRERSHTMRAADFVANLSLEPCAAHLRNFEISSAPPVEAPLSLQIECLGCPASPSRSSQNSRR